MKILTIIIAYHLTMCAFGQTKGAESWEVPPKVYKSIVLESIQAEAEKYSKEIKPREFEVSGSSVKTKSRGQSKVEELLKKQRKLIKDKNKDEKLRKKRSFITNKGNDDKKWSADNSKEYKKWINERKRALNDWKKEKVKFKKDLKNIKKGLIPAEELEKKKNQNINSKREFQLMSSQIKRDQAKTSTIIEPTFNISIKHQGERPTCASFASIRAIEINNSKSINLSEQFFHFLSRPDCHMKKCSNLASWARIGFESIQKKNTLIPLEENCKYKYDLGPEQLQRKFLHKDCFKGKTKVGQYKQLSNHREIIESLESKKPVVIGYYVNDDFLLNDGLVKDTKGVNNFAHTVLAVGKINLSKKLHSALGRYCLLVVNSWGTGWGIGGYSCIAEKWSKSKIISNPAISVSKV